MSIQGFKRFIKGLVLEPAAADPTDNLEGSLFANSTTNRVKTYIEAASREVVTADQTQTLTNKSIDGNNNTITNIPSSALAQINATKIADGSVSNTEFQYLDGVTSNIQTQLDSKQASGNFISALTGDVTATGPGSVAATIANNAVTNAKAAQMAAHTFKGNNTGSTANPIDLTATQLTAELNPFTTSLQGVVPGSGGGTTNFLRADGTWASPGTTGANTALSNLASTAINVSLIPDFDLSQSLGTAGLRWTAVYASTIKATGSDVSIDILNKTLKNSNNTVIMLDWSNSYLDVNSHKISNVTDPTSAQDAATKNYVDANSSVNGASPLSTKTTNYTATTSDQIILVDTTSGDVTITLYTSVGNSGKRITVKKISVDSNIVIIDGNASETIDGETTVSLRERNESLDIYADGSNWQTRDWYSQTRYFIAADVKANGTNAGTSSSGLNTRVINTVQASAPWASLSSNQITLQPGVYIVRARAPAYVSDQHKIRFRNITDSTTVIIGSNEQSTSGTAVQTDSFLVGRVAISATKIFELQHQITTGRVTDGLGAATSSGDSEIYAQIEIERINPRTS